MLIVFIAQVLNLTLSYDSVKLKSNWMKV